MQVHYVYLPGLGDGLFNRLRRALLIGWRLRGVSVSFVELNWGDPDELSEAKYQRALDHLTSYSDRSIGLIGESAGGSMALRLLLQSNFNIDGVITICGFNNGANYIDKRHEDEHPAFIPTVQKVDQLIENIDPVRASSITTYYSPSDEVVKLARTEIDQAKLISLPRLTHVAAIGYFLLRTTIKGIN